MRNKLIGAGDVADDGVNWPMGAKHVEWRMWLSRGPCERSNWVCTMVLEHRSRWGPYLEFRYGPSCRCLMFI